MRRRSRPIVETLEGKALLSAMPALSLATSLTAVTQATSTGTQVVLTFVETNVTRHAVNVAEGPSTDGFVVSQDGKPVWASNTGPQPLFLMLRTLKPGQSLTLHATWNDRSNLVDPSTEGPPLSGTFTVENGLDRTGHGTTFSVGKAPTHITPPGPTIHPLH